MKTRHIGAVVFMAVVLVVMLLGGCNQRGPDIHWQTLEEAMQPYTDQWGPPVSTVTGFSPTYSFADVLYDAGNKQMLVHFICYNNDPYGWQLL